jgi:hypothetical protein
LRWPANSSSQSGGSSPRASFRRAPSSPPEIRSLGSRRSIGRRDRLRHWELRAPAFEVGPVIRGRRLVYEALWSPVGSTTKLLETGTVCKAMQPSLLCARSQSNHYAKTGEIAVPMTRFSSLDRGTLM